MSSEAVLEQITPREDQIKEIAKNFKFYLLTERGTCLYTAKNYVRLVKLFLKENELTVEGATNYYIDLIGNSHYSSSFKHNIYFALKWALMSQGQEWSMKKQKLERRVRKNIDYNRCQDLLQFFRGNEPIYTITYLMLTTGVRPAEALKLKYEDIDFNDKSIIVKAGKTYKDRLIPIGDNTVEVLKKWIDDHNIKTGRLWPTNNRTLQVHFRKATEQLGFKVTPYVLRHSFCTLFIENSGDVLILKNICGHASVNTTLGYVHESKIMIRNGYNKASPVF